MRVCLLSHVELFVVREKTGLVSIDCIIPRVINLFNVNFSIVNYS
jgi:hypothetical protein